MAEKKDRWVSMGPYYAMFPIPFAEEVVLEFTKKGDLVLDPFVGRGTSVYLAAKHGRTGIGIELSELGWIYSTTKLAPAKKSRVLKRLSEIQQLAREFARESEQLPEFFHLCFCSVVREFLLAARAYLKWRSSVVDRTLMAFILVSLHDKLGAGLSNQMRQTKALSDAYSIRWWTENGLAEAPLVNPVELLSKKIDWRYTYGTPEHYDSIIFNGDCIETLPRLRPRTKVKLILTSPPYSGITNYRYDQWIRNWVLGGATRPSGARGKYDYKGENRSEYRDLLMTAFSRSARLLSDSGIVVVRTDARPFTLHCTMDALSYAFPHHEMELEDRPAASNKTQTRLFGDKSEKPGDVDIYMYPS